MSPQAGAGCAVQGVRAWEGTTQGGGGAVEPRGVGAGQGREKDSARFDATETAEAPSTSHAMRVNRPLFATVSEVTPRGLRVSA